MVVTSKLRYLRIAPRKVRLVADLVRGKSTDEAQTILNFTIKKAANPVLKLLKSAIASARNTFHLEEHNLYVSKITVDEGPKYKRWRPRARGQAGQIQKKTSHITLILDEKVKGPKKVGKIKTKFLHSRRETKSSKKDVPLKKAELPKEEKIEKEIKVIPEKPRFKPEFEKVKPKIEKKGFGRFFRRKSF